MHSSKTAWGLGGVSNHILASQWRILPSWGLHTPNSPASMEDSHPALEESQPWFPSSLAHEAPHEACLKHKHVQIRASHREFHSDYCLLWVMVTEPFTHFVQVLLSWSRTTALCQVLCCYWKGMYYIKLNLKILPFIYSFIHSRVTLHVWRWENFWRLVVSWEPNSGHQTS